MGTAANVHFLNSTNFNKFKYGYDFYGYGGYIKRSPYRISVPNAGKWYLTFDLGGYIGTIKYNYNKIKPLQETLKKN
ncbi:MAG: DUF1883 domain-containing protein [Lachnospiraceae bacterium]|nr:DUF1883 domain-containing protein [Lachnospiraceae bacterium]